MKKSVKIALIVILGLTLALALVACNDNGEISIQKSPQVTYVLGQELNLADGTLSVPKGGVVSMASSDVKVSGYDKNTLGSQELTVTYKKMTTTFTVTVVNRFEPNRGITTDYFVGEQFDGKGFFTLTRDNGTSFSVSAGADGLTVNNFNTQSAGVITVSLSYQGFSGSYNVTVHAIDATQTELYLPKTNYKSHESLSVDSGYIVLKNANGSVTRQVPVTIDMVSGFDTSVVTSANAVTPLAQQLTVHYLGLNIPYTVYITYSNVTLIHERYQELIDLVENDEDITDDIASKLFEAMKLYLELSDADKVYVQQKELTAIVQISVVYGSNQWFMEYESISNVLEIDAMGKFVFVGSYEATKAAYNMLVASDCRLVDISDLLTEIYTQFASVPLTSTSTVGSYLYTIVELSNFDAITRKMNFMFTLYDKVKLLPDNVKLEDVDKYSDELEDIAHTIEISSFNQPNDRHIYAVAAGWHVDNLYDLLYKYYLDADDVDMLQSLMTKQLPGELETLYCEILNAGDEGYLVENAVYFGEQGYVVDATLFMMYYRNANKLANAIKNGNNSLYKEIYKIITFDTSLRQLDVHGYSIVMTSMVGNKAVAAFWNDYLDMVVAYLDGGSAYLESNEFGTQITSLLDKFLSLCPSEQLGVINTLYPAYGYYCPEMGLDINGGGYSYFTLFLHSYYSRNLSDNGYRFFAYYLYGLEYYVNSNGDYFGDYFDMFKDVMQSQTLNSIYNFELHKQGREAELALVQKLHDTLDAYYKYHTKSDPDVLDEQSQSYFEQLDKAINEVLDAYIMLEANQHVYSLLIASYERAEFYANLIRNSNNKVALDAFYNAKMFVYDDNEYWTFDYALSFARNFYVYFIYYNNLTYSEYQDSAVPEFMQQIEQLLWNGWYSLIDKERETLDAQTMSDILTAYRNLSVEERYMFWFNLDYERALYGKGMRDYFETVLTDIDGIGDLVDELRLLEIKFMFYEIDHDAVDDDGISNSQHVADALQSLEEKFDLESDNEIYQLLLEMYNYYKQAYEGSVNA